MERQYLLFGMQVFSSKVYPQVEIYKYENRTFNKIPTVDPQVSCEFPPSLIITSSCYSNYVLSLQLVRRVLQLYRKAINESRHYKYVYASVFVVYLLACLC